MKVKGMVGFVEQEGPSNGKGRSLSMKAEGVRVAVKKGRKR